MIRLSIPNISNDDIQYLKNVFNSKWIVEGKVNKLLENKIKKIFGKKYCITHNSWTSAAFLIFKILNLKKDDIVLLPAYTFVACANVVKFLGAEVRFVDTDKDSVNISFQDFKNKFNKKVKAAILVDQIGIPLEIEKFKKFCERNKIFLIHDIACSLGSTYKKKQSGSSSQICITSFHARKPITSGEGGAVILNDKKIAQKLKCLKNQGAISATQNKSMKNFKFEQKYTDCGLNMRFTDIQASLLVNQIKRLKKNIARRQLLLKIYKKYLTFNNFKFPIVPKNSQNNLQSLLVIFNTASQRKKAYEKLIRKKIEAKKSISSCFNHKNYFKEAKKLKNSYELHRKSLLIPMHNNLKIKDIKKISNLLNSIN